MIKLPLPFWTAFIFVGLAMIPWCMFMDSVIAPCLIAADNIIFVLVSLLIVAIAGYAIGHFVTMTLLRLKIIRWPFSVLDDD